MSTSPHDDPVAFFAHGGWTLGVIGLGYVGLPLLVAASERGLGVAGYDVSPETVDELNSGRTTVQDVSGSQILSLLDRGGTLSSDPSVLRGVDAIAVCVPSPLKRSRQPDLSFIEAAAATVSEVVQPATLVVLESTTYPGTTEDLIVPAVARAGLTLDVDAWVAYSPERVSPGDAMKVADIPKILGGVTECSTAVGAAAYRRIVRSVHEVSSARAAEMTKLLENTYRAVNIGLVNEMAQLAEALDIDIWEVIDAAATKPFGFHPFRPGPGVGGHCIPLDPHYLAWTARGVEHPTRFVDAAELTNAGMPRYCASRIEALLSGAGKGISGSRILAVGVAYKRNVGDCRESASVDVISELTERGAAVEVLDPHVPPGDVAQLGLVPADPQGPIGGYDLAVVLTDHDIVDYGAVANAAPVVFDTRAVYRRLGIEHDNVVLL